MLQRAMPDASFGRRHFGSVIILLIFFSGEDEGLQTVLFNKLNTKSGWTFLKIMFSLFFLHSHFICYTFSVS